MSGDPASLVGHVLEVAELRTNSADNEPEYAESWTWSFYEFRTVGGSVTLRWLGESNGYYSEEVTFSPNNDAAREIVDGMRESWRSER